MTEKTFDPRLGDRAVNMLIPLIAAADGILDAGTYGATWKSGPPDIAVYLGHVGAGFVSLQVRDQSVGDWLQKRYGVQDDNSVLLFSCTNGWIMTTLPVYRQLILDAAQDEKLILASPDFPALVKELAESEGDGGHEHHEHHHGVERMENILSRIEQAVDQAVSEIKKRPRVKTAEERWPNIDKILAKEANAELLALAETLQEQLEQAIQPVLDNLGGEYLGEVPSDTSTLTRDDAHIHAYICLDNGLVYMHAKETDEYLGVPFLGEILARAPEGESPEGHPILEQAGPHGEMDHVGRLAFGISNLPWVVALAKCLGILIWQGDDCFANGPTAD